MKAVKSDNEFSTNSEKFQSAIEKALKTIVPEKASRQDPARAKLTREFLNEITGTSLGTRELGDIITAYLIGDETVGRVEKREKTETFTVENYEAQEFRDAMKGGEIRMASIIFDRGNGEQRLSYSKYLIGLGIEKIVSLMRNGGSYICMGWLLKVVLIYADQEFIDIIFKRTKPSSRSLSSAASNLDLACRPDKFINLLSRIADKDCQRDVVEGAVITLFRANKTKCFDALFSALENARFLDQTVKDVAIRQAFFDASKFPNDTRALYAKRFHNHPVISARYYSMALCRSYKFGNPNRGLFYWLLARADREDLSCRRRLGWNACARAARGSSF